MVKYILPENLGLYYSEVKYIGSYYTGTSLETILPEINKKLFGISFTYLPLELGGKLKYQN